ncbi:MAG: hypothetical protein GKR93_13805 [Gammaproteobacteria bacterium]|nr:hypothetical protein [Gammaproteobacteria bacterium]
MSSEEEIFVFILFMLFTIIIIPVLVIAYRSYYGNRAYRFGYDSRAEYLKSSPKSDDEKRDAVDQACKGLVTCLLALMFPPLLLVGLFPLFYGTRKTIYACMGLGVDEEPERIDS